MTRRILVRSVNKQREERLALGQLGFSDLKNAVIEVDDIIVKPIRFTFHNKKELGAIIAELRGNLLAKNQRRDIRLHSKCGNRKVQSILSEQEHDYWGL